MEINRYVGENLTINPNKCLGLLVQKPPPLPSPFSLADADHQITQVTDTHDPGIPPYTTFTASVHSIEAANIARRLLFIVCRSFKDLSKTAFFPLYCGSQRLNMES